MKVLFAAIAVFVMTSVSAQIKEGYIKYECEVSASDPQMEMAVAMMEGSTMETCFTETMTRTKMTMGAFITNTTIVDIEKNEMLMLMSGMMGEMAIPISSDEIDEMEAEGDDEDTEVELINETKKIAGYKCKKAIVTTGDEEVEMWYTEELDVNRKGSKVGHNGVPGYPLAFSSSNSGLVMEFTAVEVVGSLTDDQKESMTLEIPEGYEVKSMDDLKKMGGGM